jgi:hypothetical protein
MLLQCDWLKLNGSFYLILDMNEQEFQSFKMELDRFEAEGKILYGVHRSSAALIICHLNSKSQKKHFHFVDGSEGGLTAAASVLKEKKKRLSSL